MCNLLIPIEVGYWQLLRIPTAVRSSIFLKQTMAVSPGRHTDCRFLNQVRLLLMQKRQIWVGSMYRSAGFPSNKPAVPTLALADYLRPQTVGIAGVASRYLSLTAYISAIHTPAGLSEDRRTTSYSKHRMVE